MKKMKKSKEFYKLLEKEGLFDFYSNVDDNFIDEKFEAINYLLQVLDSIEDSEDYYKGIKKAYLHNCIDQDEEEELQEAVEELEELEKDYLLKCKMIMDTIYTLKDIQKDMEVK